MVQGTYPFLEHEICGGGGRCFQKLSMGRLLSKTNWELCLGIHILLDRFEYLPTTGVNIVSFIRATLLFAARHCGGHQVMYVATSQGTTQRLDNPAESSLEDALP